MILAINKIVIRFVLIAGLLLVVFWLTNSAVYAQCEGKKGTELQVCLVDQTDSLEGDTCDTDRTFLGIPSWDAYLPKTYSAGKCNPTIDGFSSALPIGVAVLEMLLRLSAIVAVGMMFIGAFRFVTSNGNPEGAAAARKTVMNALIGLVIVVLSTAVVNYLGGTLAS